ncbi:RNA-guided endonuclease TnpB family protein [Lactobacillus helveticus]|uniref:RNA-guided endonuclease TnpB family protein n=1 Tax=Lactobacillus helveticus TaxID=1587 RepID=UPI00081A8CB8|nr:RNA-guided endonuclease TnpB family protein [Lactobacillus helveticus]ANZ56455.1 transposase [Lactobacillus helveticus]AQY52896.1 transposase [Lactobacillus helveticus]AUJ27545.1 transposase [Lactobacillus helveticus]AZA21847.1 MAG: transposase [Lactobacillus helveticus]URN36850.1 RNA-guided endonuclease TnpB family protein [Lactobacillus helveticus]
MDQSVVIKAQLLNIDDETAQAFSNTMCKYRDACNFISQYIFEHAFELKQSKLNKALYHDLRDKFELKSQMAQSAIKTVIARYKTVKTQLFQHPFRYDTGKKDGKGRGIWAQIYRDLTWLWQPINFKRPQLDLQRGRDWSYLSATNQLSLNTLNGRRKVDFVCKGFDQYLDQTKWKFGSLKMLQLRGKWYIHLSATTAIPEFEAEQAVHVVGIDRGLRFLAACYDEKGKSILFSGQKILRKRRKYKKLRAELQAKGTKSAKRRLKKIGQRENRWMSDVNHRLTKTLIDHYGSNTIYALEDLTDVRFATEKSPKDQRYEIVSWAFYQFEQFLTYKANLNSSAVVKVPAKYTSQRCPKCGRIHKDNRDHELHLYTCDKCGYKSNDDRLAAMNIQFLGTLYRSGKEAPQFNKQASVE